MSQHSKERDRTARVEPPRAVQDLGITGEGVSKAVEDVLDDGTTVSDGRHKKQSCRDFSNSGKLQRRKEKQRLETKTSS